MAFRVPEHHRTGLFTGSLEDDSMDVRDAEDTEVDELARVWYDGWHESHAAIVPAELTRLRTLESFRQRLQQDLLNVRVVGPPGQPVGFCTVKGAELYQLFVSKSSRGTGLAAALIADAETRLAAGGVETAWLACAIGNERAARFYEKCGWHRVGTMANRLDTSIGQFPLDVWRYEKSLRPARAGERHRQFP
jgi:ribosomal protein S18 acetylase RimI-like enzyme